ncbi:MAG: hypothetical protein ACRDP5_28270 [Streptosporangiaceae bacterium]
MSDSTSFSTRKRGRGGRPSKGPRLSMTVRCPEPLAEAIDAARAGSGLTNNDFILGLIEMAMEAGLCPAAAPASQDRLPLSA